MNRNLWLLLSCCLLSPALLADDAGKVVFHDDFESGRDRWETTDEDAWGLRSNNGNTVFGILQRKSDYEPAVRSPHNIALIKDLEIGDGAIQFRVRSTLDTGNHRDCCVFFGYQDPTHFYYAHLGAKPDPASGQIMIVDGAPRRPLTKNERNVPWDDGWHVVRLERSLKDGSIKVYFDDLQNPLMSASDDTFGVGRVGIGSFDDRNDFDEVRVIQLPSP